MRTSEGYSFAIADVRTDQAMGQIGLWLRDIDHGRASIGYWVEPRFHNEDIRPRPCRPLTDWALTLDEAERLELYVEPWNKASWRAAERCGYQRRDFSARGSGWDANAGTCTSTAACPPQPENWNVGEGFTMSIIGANRAALILEVGDVHGTTAVVIVHATQAREKFLR